MERVKLFMNEVGKQPVSYTHLDVYKRQELYRQNRSITWFAEQLCCSRSNIYKIFSHSDINTMLLLKISVILHCNFFRYYSDTLGDIEKM